MKTDRKDYVISAETERQARGRRRRTDALQRGYRTGPGSLEVGVVVEVRRV